MGLRRWKNAGVLVLAAAVLLGWQPGVAAAESRRRSAGRGSERHEPSGRVDRLEQATEAAERAGVEARDVRDLMELCERGEFTEAQTLRIINLSAQLALEELPVRSFVEKVGEGVSKRVDPENIVQVAERRALFLNRAKSILNAILLDGAPVREREELVPDVAEALEAGAAPELVRRELYEGFAAGDSIGEIRRRIFP